jgi:hypothetical protein
MMGMPWGPQPTQAPTGGPSVFAIGPWGTTSGPGHRADGPGDHRMMVVDSGPGREWGSPDVFVWGGGPRRDSGPPGGWGGDRPAPSGSSSNAPSGQDSPPAQDGAPTAPPPEGAPPVHDGPPPASNTPALPPPSPGNGAPPASSPGGGDRPSSVGGPPPRPVVPTADVLGGSVSVARDEAAPAVAVAIPVMAGAGGGAAATAGAALGVVVAASFGGAAGIRDGRPVFDGGAGPMVADLAAPAPGVRPVEAGRPDLVPSGKIHGGGPEQVEVASSTRGIAPHEVPSPQRSDLLTDLVTFDRTSLEHAIDRFLERSEDLGAGLSRLGEPSYLLAGVFAAAAAVAIARTIPGISARSAAGRGALAAVDSVETFEGFSGLSGP